MRYKSYDKLQNDIIFTLIYQINKKKKYWGDDSKFTQPAQLSLLSVVNNSSRLLEQLKELIIYHKETEFQPSFIPASLVPCLAVCTAAPVTEKQATHVANNLWKIEKCSKNSKGTL